ncbi:MAG: hypothetical protein ACI308_05500 [Muribaculaceae bacterium]
MEQGKFYKQAEEVASANGFASATYAGIENDCEYYLLNRAYKKGHYFGRPSFIKFSKQGIYEDVDNIAEEGRALSRIRRLHKSS